MLFKTVLFLFISAPLIAMEITMFQVGQGSCTLVSQATERSLLCDAGSDGRPFDGTTGKEIDKKHSIKEIIEAIENRTPTKKITIIISHPDRDHSGWVPDIAPKLCEKAFNVTLLLGGTLEKYAQAFRKVIRSLAKKYQCRYKTIGNLDTVHEEYATHTDVLQAVDDDFLPPYCTIVYAQKECAAKKANELSIITKVGTDDNFTVLLPGDAPTKVTDWLMKNMPDDLKATTLLAFHHGSKHDNSRALTEAIGPDKVIIPAGLRKGHNHPSRETMELYKKYFQDTIQTCEPHMLTTFYGKGLQHFDSEEAADDAHRLVAYSEDLFAHGPATCPVYNTTNGAVSIDTESDSITQQNQGTDVGTLALCTPQIASFRAITALVLSHYGFTDADVKKHMRSLPPSLSYLDVRNNDLSTTIIMKLLSLVKHNNPFLYKVKGNQPLYLDKLSSLLKSVGMQKKQGTVTVSADAVESFSLNQDGPFLPRRCALSYFGKSWDTFADKKPSVLKRKIFTMTINNEWVAFYNSSTTQIEVWNTRTRKMFISVPKIDEQGQILALHFDMSCRFLAIVYNDSVQLLCLNTKEFTELHGTLLHEDHQCSSQQGLEYEFNNYRSFGLLIKRPFTVNGDYLVTIMPAENKVIIWSTENSCIHSTIERVNLQEAQFCFFTDYDRTVRIQYKNGSYCELPLVL